MLVCVDGTGASDSAEYARIFARSFVNRVKNEYLLAHPPPDPAPIHHRGPGADLSDAGAGSFGGIHHVSPQFVFDEIMTVWERLNDEVDAMPAWASRRDVRTWSADETAAFEAVQQRRRLFMVGHSRGAAIVIHTARLLNARGIPVEAMFLFDAVARNMSLDAEEIPPNVGHCYHAVRDPSGHSRGSFGNCGLRAATGVDFQPSPWRYFLTTHGGMGGTPWGRDPAHMSSTGTFIAEGDPMGSTVITPEQEAAGMAEVEAWMWPHLRRHGVVP
jgi:hypothetical protein